MNPGIRSKFAGVLALAVTQVVTIANAAPPRAGSDTVVIYAVDVSGSTQYPWNYSCSNQMETPPEVKYPNGFIQCEIAAVASMNRQAIQDRNIGQVGLVVIGARATPAIVDPDRFAFVRDLTTPDAYAGDPKFPHPDLEVAARSLRIGGVYRFEEQQVFNGTNLFEAVRTSCLLARRSSLPNKIVVIITDDTISNTDPRQALNYCAGVVTVNVVIPQNRSCGTPIGQVAVRTGGTCSSLSWEDIANLSLPPTSTLVVSREHLGSFAGLGSLAWDVNSRGDVVGVSAIGGQANPMGRAFLWRNSSPGLLDLGFFADLGHDMSEAWRINDAGHVAGYSSVKNSEQRRGFRITPLDTNGDGIPDQWFKDTDPADGINDLMEKVPTLGGEKNMVNDMNQLGQVVGDSTIVPTSYDVVHAYLWSPETGAMDLGTPGGARSSAIAITDDGVVFGHGQDASGQYRYFRVTPFDSNGDSTPDIWFQDANGDGMNDLMTLVDLEVPAAAILIQPREMNNDREIAGAAYFPDSLGFLWEPNGSATQLGTLGGSSSAAFDINDRGQVAGWSMTAGGASHPFLWTRARGMDDLGELSNSTGPALAINSLGDLLAGYSNNAGEMQAAIWRIYNTAVGRSIVVDPETGITLTFSEVSQQGYTDVIQTRTPGPGVPPPDFEFNGVYYSITSTADFAGDVQICIPSPPSPLPTIRHLRGIRWVNVPTTYDWNLGAACGVVSSFSWFTVELNHHAPEANAGPDQVVYCDSSAGAFVDLDGSASFDPDGDSLTYAWTGVFGSSGGAAPTVTLPMGKNAVSLVVSDGVNNSYPNDTLVQVVAGVSGLIPPLGALAPEEGELVMPDAAFKEGRTLPLRLTLSCGPAKLTDTDVSAPVLETVQRIDEVQDLAVVDVDAGQANAGSDMFRYADNEWIYNLSTKGLQPGTYRIVIRMPDGMGYQTAVVLR